MKENALVTFNEQFTLYIIQSYDDLELLHCSSVSWQCNICTITKNIFFFTILLVFFYFSRAEVQWEILVLELLKVLFVLPYILLVSALSRPFDNTIYTCPSVDYQ